MSNAPESTPKRSSVWLPWLVVGLLLLPVAIAGAVSAAPAWDRVKVWSRQLENCETSAQYAKLGATGNYHPCSVAEQNTYVSALCAAQRRAWLYGAVSGTASLVVIVSFALAFRGYRRRRAVLAAMGLA